MTTALRYSLRRVFLLLITMLLVSLLTYLAFELVSGDPARTMLGTEATEAQVQALRHEMGLDRPFAERYIRWLGGFFSGDLGVSYSYRQPVWGLISGKLELTLWLSLMSFVLITVISIPLGIFSYRFTGTFAGWPRTVLNQLCKVDDNSDHAPDQKQDARDLKERRTLFLHKIASSKNYSLISIIKKNYFLNIFL